jgi:light-regulated signal transduction histidine kinase (bacteriophytochrome)
VTLDSQTQLRRRDGEPIPIDDSAAPIRDDQGRTTGAVLVFRDSSERLRAEMEIRELNEQLEQRVQARTAQLTAANQELESFSYSVSHDLRAPLRAINGFSNILMDRCATQLDAEGKRLLGTVCQAASRMGQMVDDFLNLARVGRQPLHLIPADMNTLVTEALADLGAEAKRPNLTITVPPLPSACVDPALLRQVWVNLLANAVKFSAQRERPAIEVNGRFGGNELIYSVKDNGVGFDMDYASKLFGTFQRLHSNEEFEGTGVGLAIVQRIIRRLGGRVWAEGLVDHGATFFFALPAQPAADESDP